MSRDGSIAGLAGGWGEGRAGSHAYDGIQTEEQEQVLRRRVHDSLDFHLLSGAGWNIQATRRRRVLAGPAWPTGPIPAPACDGRGRRTGPAPRRPAGPSQAHLATRSSSPGPGGAGSRAPASAARAAPGTARRRRRRALRRRLSITRTADGNESPLTPSVRSSQLPRGLWLKAQGCPGQRSHDAVGVQPVVALRGLDCLRVSGPKSPSGAAPIRRCSSTTAGPVEPSCNTG